MTHKPKYRSAVGLALDETGSNAPTLEVMGDGTDADLIVQLAERFGVPVVEHPVVARLLSQHELDREIPPALFEAVATILVHLERQGYTVKSEAVKSDTES